MGGPPSVSERGGKPFKEGSDLAQAERDGNRRSPTPDEADPQDELTWPGQPPTREAEHPTPGLRTRLSRRRLFLQDSSRATWPEIAGVALRRAIQTNATIEKRLRPLPGSVGPNCSGNRSQAPPAAARAAGRPGGRIP